MTLGNKFGKNLDRGNPYNNLGKNLRFVNVTILVSILGTGILGSPILVTVLVRILGRGIFVTTLVRIFGDPGNNFGKSFHFVNLGYNL